MKCPPASSAPSIAWVLVLANQKLRRKHLTSCLPRMTVWYTGTNGRGCNNFTDQIRITYSNFFLTMRGINPCSIKCIHKVSKINFNNKN